MISNILRRLEFARFYTTHQGSLATIHKWQSRQFSTLLRHAFMHVPMWRKILSEVHIDAKHITNLDSLKKIPLTSKNTYIGRMVEEYVDNSSRFFFAWRTTSGTSGTPFQSIVGGKYIGSAFYMNFAQYRFLLWNKYKRTNWAIETTKIARIKCEWKTKSSESRLNLKYSDFRRDPTRVYLQLAEFRPEVLVAYPSVLLDIAQMIETDKVLPPLAPGYILSTSEELTPQIRSYVGTILGCDVYSRYGLEEMGVVGTECARHDGIHINAESFIVEVTDELGEPVPECQHGKVVVTDLNNYNMPFIRYDTGDRGFITYKSCSCGLCSPRLWLNGRTSIYLTFGNRRISRYDIAALDAFMHYIFQFQVVKKSENELLLRIIPGPMWENQIRNKILEEASKFVGKDINVSIELVSEISRAPSGKSNLLVDESISVTQ